MKKVVIAVDSGEVINTTVSDDATAKEYEDLAFEPGGQVVRVDVSDAD